MHLQGSTGDLDGGGAGGPGAARRRACGAPAVVGTLGSRLARVEATGQARLQRITRGPAMLVLVLDALSAEDRVLFDGEDLEARADVVERQTGQRPGPGTRLILIVGREDGPE